MASETNRRVGNRRGPKPKRKNTPKPVVFKLVTANGGNIMVFRKRSLRKLRVNPRAVKRFEKASRAVGKAVTGPTARKGVKKGFRTAKTLSNELFGKPKRRTKK